MATEVFEFLDEIPKQAGIGLITVILIEQLVG